jgi:RNA polymerase sigma-70 factor (ECF subfamily)
VPYTDIAKALDLQEATCRKLVSRARANIDRSKVRHVTPLGRQEELLAAFEAAVASGSTDRLAALLSDDIALCADGGGKVAAIRHVLRGRAEVLAFIAENLRAYWNSCDWATADINGGKGVILRKDGVTTASVSFAYDEAGKATNIYIMRNPDKLAGLSRPPISLN